MSFFPVVVITFKIKFIKVMDDNSHSESYYTNCVMLYTNGVIRHPFNKLTPGEKAAIFLSVLNLLHEAFVVLYDN